MSEAQKPTKQNSRNTITNIKILLICFIIGTGVIYFFSNPSPQIYYDYTFRVAENLLQGRVGFTEEQPSWLNEFVPFERYYYSVFPFGSVLTMLPFAFLKLIGIITDMPSAYARAPWIEVEAKHKELAIEKLRVEWLGKGMKELSQLA